MGKLANKTALITGGSKGIGLATAKLFAAEGAQVIITGRNLTDLQDAVEEIPGKVSYIQSDTSNLQDIQTLFSEIATKYNKIDALFVNAGIAEGSHISDTTEAFFDNHININYKGAFFTAKESLPYLADKASIVFNASVNKT